MINSKIQNYWRCLSFILAVSLFTVEQANAQGNIAIQTGLIDGLELNPTNIFGYQIQSNFSTSLKARITGMIRYRNQDHWIGYSLTSTLNPGINSIDRHVSVDWTYSSISMKELFNLYNTMPSGTYEYCIKVIPENQLGELDAGQKTEECMFYKNQELFLINLMTPEDNAKIYDYHPMFNWIANCSFVNELTYKYKLTEIKKGQNTINAVLRNNPIYQEGDLRMNTINYPLTAKPLVAYQPYAWTVDAYYKNILVGSAEAWRFVILEDSVKDVIPRDVSYIDFVHKETTNKYYALGSLKLKYQVKDHMEEFISLKLYKDGTEIHLKDETMKLRKGDNKFQIDFTERNPLKHNKSYMLEIKTSTGNTYQILFHYINPEFL